MEPIDRRSFIKKSCGACLLGVAGVVLPGFLKSARANTILFATELTPNNQLLVPLNLFTGVDFVIVRVRGWYADIAAHPKDDGSNTYLALLMQCTHMSNNLMIQGTNFTCSAHGSRFNEDGQVIRGPAEDPLVQYPNAVVDANLVITVPPNLMPS